MVRITSMARAMGTGTMTPATEVGNVGGESGSRTSAWRRGRLAFAGLPVLALLFAANHVEHHLRQRSPAGRSKAAAVVVRGESGPLGHATIAVDESSTSGTTGDAFLHFSTLAAWEFDPDNPSPCPEPIRSLHGRILACVGFMYPLVAGSDIKLFCLLRTTQTCCYGPRPQFNQYVFVEMKEPVPFERLKPVVVEGVFFVDPKPDDGYIYRLEGAAAQAVPDDVPDIDADEAAREAGLPLFDFAPLTELRNLKQSPGNTEMIHGKFRSLAGSKVVLAGFFVGSTEGTPPALIVGKHWWDGVTQGTPPDLYNAVMVFPRDEKEVPPAWKQKVVFTGTLGVTGDKKLYPDNGVISIRDAVRGVPGHGGTTAGSGPFLAIWHEAVILGAFLAVTLGRSRRPERRVAPPPCPDAGQDALAGQEHDEPLETA